MPGIIQSLITPADPYTVLLLRGENGNGSTTFTDYSAYNNVFTASGTCQNSTAQAKFGSGSIAFATGGAGHLVGNGSSNFAFGTNDFTIEMWYFATSAGSNFYIYDGRNAGTDGLYPTLRFASSDATVRYYVNGSDQIIGGGFALSTWTHWVVCRSGTNTKMFRDGTQTGSTWTTDSTNYAVLSSTPVIGSLYDNTGNLPGYIDELRISKGIARYTANFTAPTSPYPR